MKKLIRQIDIFGTQVGFVVNQDQYYKTAVGASGTIVFGILTMFLIINGLNGVFKRQTITVFQQKSLGPQSDNMTIDNTNFMFAIKIHKKDQEQSLPVYAQLIESKYWSNQIQNFTLVQCQPSNFQQLSFFNTSLKDELIGISDLSSWYCPASNFSIMIYRDVDITLSKDFLFKFFVNNTDNNVLILDVLIAYSQINEYSTQPSEGHLQTESYMIDPLLKQSVSNALEFYKWVIDTDQSVYPLPDVTEEIYYLTSITHNQQQFITQSEANICFTLVIKSSRQVVTSKRQYEKISKQISFLGGFIEVMRIMFFLIFSTYNSFDLWLKLSRTFFVMHIHESALKDDTEQSDNESSRKSTMSRRKAGNVFSFNSQDAQNEDIVEEKPKKDSSVQTRKKAIKNKVLSLQEFQSQLSLILESTKVLVPKFRYYMTAALCRFNRKFAKNRIVFSTAIDIITQDLDIFRYIQALSDIEKLKRLLLNDEQRQLFEFKQKQDVFIKKDSQGKMVVSRAFTQNQNEDKKSKSMKLVEPNAMAPMHVQLSVYEQVYKILIKLRSQQVESETLIFRINHGLTQFLRQDVKDLFEQMLDQNDKQSLIQRYKQKKDSISRRSIEGNIRLSSIDLQSQQVDSPINQESCFESIQEEQKENQQFLKPLLQQPHSQVEVEIEMQSFTILEQKELQSQPIDIKQQKNQSSNGYSIFDPQMKDEESIQIIEQREGVDLLQMFQEKLQLLHLDNVVDISLKSYVEWEEDKDKQPFGILNCYIKIKNISNAIIDQCLFNLESGYLIKFEKNVSLDKESGDQCKQQNESQIEWGTSLQLLAVYQIIPIESILCLSATKDISEITLEEILSVTNQRIMVTFSILDKQYQITLRIHNSVIKNWITQRPNTNLLVQEANNFIEEIYYNIGKGLKENYINLKKVINQESMIDKTTLINEIKMASNDPESYLDLEQHFEEQATLDNVMFIFTLNPKLLNMLSSQYFECQKVFPLSPKNLFPCTSQKDHLDQLKKEYSCYVEIQYNKNQTTSLFYLCTQTKAQEEEESFKYYQERSAIIHITHLALASYYRQQICLQIDR